MDYIVSFQELPKSLEEMNALKEAKLLRPEDTAALTVAALCVYPSNHEECYRMLDALRGPRPLSPFEKQFIRDRFMDGKDYIARSYFHGAVPENDYQPSKPYTIAMADSAAQMADEGYKILNLRSGGADSPRSVTLRHKPSTGQWFLWEQMLLAGIRIPVSQDDWA